MKKLGLIFVFLICCCSYAALAGEFALKDGDRVVFYGDSITQDGTYSQLVEWYTTTRFPERNIAFFYAGVGGDRVSGGGSGSIDQRLERDVIALKPTVVTLMLGMNDGGYQPFNEKLYHAYTTGYRKIVARLKEALPGVRLTLIQPSPFDDIAWAPQFDGGYDGVLRRYGQFMAELAKQQGATLADFGTPVNNGLKKLQEANPALARQLIPDRVHPGSAGHFVMGAALLRAWGAPELVSQVSIDAEKKEAPVTENVSVAGIELEGGKLRWKQTDKVYPLPFDFSDGDIELAEKAGAGLLELNQQILKITGLAPGRYALGIEGQKIVTASESEWAQGINLGRYRTPILWSNSRPTRWGVEGRKEIQTIRRQALVSSAKDSSFNQTAEDLSRLEAILRADQRKSLQPKERLFELSMVMGSTP